MGRLGLMSLPFGNAHCSTAQTPERRMPVKQFKDLNACIAVFQALLAGNDIRPEQKKDVEAALAELRRLRRKQDAAIVYRSVRHIAERLVSAFFKK